MKIALVASLPALASASGLRKPMFGDVWNPCAFHQCANGGVCIPDIASQPLHYICDCSNTGYVGSYCNTSLGT